MTTAFLDIKMQSLIELAQLNGYMDSCEMYSYKTIGEAIENVDTETTANYLIWFSEQIVNARWIAAEPYIMKDTVIAYFYARDVIKGRWPEAEPCIMKDKLVAKWYTHDVIKGKQTND